MIVLRTDCVGETETKFSCVARVRSSDDFGRSLTEALPISGTCDDAGCVWRVEPS